MTSSLRIVILALFIFTSYWFFSPFLPSLTIGVMFALTLNSTLGKYFNKFSPLKKSLIITALFSLMVIIPLIFLIISGTVQAKELLSQLSQNPAEDIFLFISQNSHLQNLLDKTGINIQNYKQFLSSNFEYIKEMGISLVQKTLTTIPLILFNFMLLLAAIFFTLLDGKNIREIFASSTLIPKKFTVFIWKEFKAASKGILVSSLLTALVQASIIAIPALILDFKNSLLIIFATFICSLIPLVGTTPITLIMLGVNYYQDDYVSLFIYLIVGLFLGVIDNVIRAKIIGDSSQIHPLFAFLSAIGGVMTFGFFGIFLGPLLFILSWKSFTYVLKEGKNETN